MGLKQGAVWNVCPGGQWLSGGLLGASWLCQLSAPRGLVETQKGNRKGRLQSHWPALYAMVQCAVAAPTAQLMPETQGGRGWGCTCGLAWRANILPGGLGHASAMF